MNMYAADGSDSQESNPKPEDGNESENSFLVPKEAFGGKCKVDDVYKVRVVAIHQDELEVEPVGEEKTDKSKSTEDEDMENPVDKMMG